MVQFIQSLPIAAILSEGGSIQVTYLCRPWLDQKKKNSINHFFFICYCCAELSSRVQLGGGPAVQDQPGGHGHVRQELRGLLRHHVRITTTTTKKKGRKIFRQKERKKLHEAYIVRSFFFPHITHARTHARHVAAADTCWAWGTGTSTTSC